MLCFILQLGDAAFLRVCVVNTLLLYVVLSMTLRRGLKRPERRHKSDSATLQIDPGMRAERGNVDGAVTGESGWPSNPSTHAAVCNSS